LKRKRKEDDDADDDTEGRAHPVAKKSLNTWVGIKGNRKEKYSEKRPTSVRPSQSVRPVLRSRIDSLEHEQLFNHRRNPFK
jgi:hypothetical protein